MILFSYLPAINAFGFDLKFGHLIAIMYSFYYLILDPIAGVRLNAYLDLKF